MLNPGDAMDRGASWAVRTVPERDILDYLLSWYLPAPRGQVQEDAARRSMSTALGRWRAMGLASAADSDGQPLFDPAEVFNFAMAASVEGRDPYWLDYYASAHAAMVASFHGSAAPIDRAPDAGDLPPRRFRVALRRDYDLSGFTAGRKIRLRLPVPIGDDCFDLESISFAIPDAASHRTDQGRLEVQFTLATPGIISIGFQACFVARPDLGQQDALSADDVRLYTAPRENLIVVSPLIRQLAQEIGGGEAAIGALVLRFYDHVNAAFLLGRVPYHALDHEWPTDWPIREGWVDCQMGSALLCALCRAAGIPARLVSGYLLYESNLAFHYWAEIFIDGRWRPFDFLTWGLIRTMPQQGWDRAFAGRIDYRLKVQIMPKIFTGPSSMNLSPMWHNFTRREGRSLTNQFTDAPTNTLLYRDHLELISSDLVQGEN